MSFGSAQIGWEKEFDPETPGDVYKEARTNAMGFLHSGGAFRASSDLEKKKIDAGLQQAKAAAREKKRASGGGGIGGMIGGIASTVLGAALPGGGTIVGGLAKGLAPKIFGG